MLRLAIIFLVIALIAAFLGFGGVASLSWAGAQILFFVFLVLAVLSFLAHGFGRRGILRLIVNLTSTSNPNSTQRN